MGEDQWAERVARSSQGTFGQWTEPQVLTFVASNDLPVKTIVAAT